MLQQGLIKPSQYPFSSPVLLVRKVDNSWSFYVDYCVLNSHIVKNKFPISVIEELLETLHGASFFSKLDLGFSYVFML